MQFLRTVFWVVLAVLGVFFSVANWTRVTVNIWAGNVVDVYLPLLLIATFLLGLVPMLIVHRTTRWSLRRRLDTANRTLSETQAAMPSVVAPAEHAHAADQHRTVDHHRAGASLVPPTPVD